MIIIILYIFFENHVPYPSFILFLIDFFCGFAENNFLKKETKRKEAPQTAREECPSSTSPTSSLSSSARLPSDQDSVAPAAEEISPSDLRPVPPPRKEREDMFKTRRVSVVRIPSDQDSVARAADGLTTLRPVSPPLKERAETIEARQVSPVRVPSEEDTKLSLQSAWPVLPPIPQKAPLKVSKQVKGKKPSKKPRYGEFVCRLSDCPHHNKPKDGCAVVTELEPVGTNTGPTVERDLGQQKSLAGPKKQDLKIPYRPKGGFITDPELMKKRTRFGPVTNRTTGAESTSRRQGTSDDKQGAETETTNSENLSQMIECFTHTDSSQSTHYIRYMSMHIQNNELHYHTATICNVTIKLTSAPDDRKELHL